VKRSALPLINCFARLDTGSMTGSVAQRGTWRAGRPRHNNSGEVECGPGEGAGTHELIDRSPGAARVGHSAFEVSLFHPSKTAKDD
jgi:hypothetical protein